MAKLTKLNDLALTAFPGEPDSTPTTLSIPTPDIDDNLALVAVHNTVWEPNDGGHAELPGAPRMKDLDSFTEGTGKGSFDSIPAASTNEFGEPIHGPNALSLELLPIADPNQSVELWREDVFIVNHTESSVMCDTGYIVPALDFDDFDGLADMTLLSPNQESSMDWPRMSVGIATSASHGATRPVDCHIKRARSSSPDLPRRTRPRSKSLISVCSAPIIDAAAELVCPTLNLSVLRGLPRTTFELPD